MEILVEHRSLYNECFFFYVASVKISFWLATTLIVVSIGSIQFLFNFFICPKSLTVHFTLFPDQRQMTLSWSSQKPC